MDLHITLLSLHRRSGHGHLVLANSSKPGTGCRIVVVATFIVGTMPGILAGFSCARHGEFPPCPVTAMIFGLVHDSRVKHASSNNDRFEVIWDNLCSESGSGGGSFSRPCLNRASVSSQTTEANLVQLSFQLRYHKTRLCSVCKVCAFSFPPKRILHLPSKFPFPARAP